MAINDEDVIGDKILHILSIYPIISPTMLQAGIGPSVKSTTWRPILQELVISGKVMERSFHGTTYSGRHNNYVQIYLPGAKGIE